MSGRASRASGDGGIRGGLAALALAALISLLSLQPVPPADLPGVQTTFDAARAAVDLADLSADHPERLVGTGGSRQAAAWLLGRLEETGLAVHTLPFTVTVASQARPGLQLWAVSPGASAEILLVSAHYDTASPQVAEPWAGAARNDAAVAAVLELARLFALEPHQRTLIFMLSDAQVYGRYSGARRFAESFPERDRIMAVLDLELAANGSLRRLRVDGAGLQRGFAPLWLRELTLEAGASAGAPVAEPGPWNEYLQRALPLGTGDHSAYLQAGLPAVGLRGELAASGRAGALETLGRAAETWLRALDRLEPVPDSPSHYLRLSRTRYLPGQILDLPQLLVFGPLLFAAAMAWRAANPRRGDLQPEWTAVLAVCIVLADGFALAYSLVITGLLPQFDLHPATPGDPLLLRPAVWAALAIYGGLGLFAWLVFRPFGGWGRLADLLNLPQRRLALLVLLSALVIAAYYLNSFAASAFLGLAACLWPWVEPRPSLAGKVVNLTLALLGAGPFLAAVLWLTERGGLGPWWWYLPLAAASGLLPLPAVLAFVAGAALLVRFIRLGLRG